MILTIFYIKFSNVFSKNSVNQRIQYTFIFVYYLLLWIENIKNLIIFLNLLKILVKICVFLYTDLILLSGTFISWFQPIGYVIIEDHTKLFININKY